MPTPVFRFVEVFGIGKVRKANGATEVAPRVRQVIRYPLSAIRCQLRAISITLKTKTETQRPNKKREPTGTERKLKLRAKKPKAKSQKLRAKS
jgi:hypothetical protein